MEFREKIVRLKWMKTSRNEGFQGPLLLVACIKSKLL